MTLFPMGAMHAPARSSFPSLFRHAAVALSLAGAATGVLAVAQAAVQPAAAGIHFASRGTQIAPYGYVDNEFWISGLGTTYKASGALGSDGKWKAVPVSTSTPYQTTMIVRRPTDASKFNGIVVVEWLNVSSGYIIDVDWAMSKEHFLREGYAYVGILNQKTGLDGSKKAYPARYANGNLPNDDISYDILSQTGKAIRDQPQLILGGLTPQKVLATGHSQSAIRLVTYVNAIHPLDKVFDGFVIHGRGNSGFKLSSNDSASTPSSAAIRADTSSPVFQLQSEMDVDAQPETSKAVDSAKVRFWEVAGASHADKYLLDAVYEISIRDTGVQPASCLKPASTMPFYRAQNAVYSHLVKWVTQGTLPPVAPRIKRSVFGKIQRDSDGNALGGLRLPEINVPVAEYGIKNYTTGSLSFLDLFACTTAGSTERFSALKLSRLYPNAAAYFNKYKAAADTALAAGHLLPADHAKAVETARTSPVPR